MSKEINQSSFEFVFSFSKKLLKVPNLWVLKFSFPFMDGNILIFEEAEWFYD